MKQHSPDLPNTPKIKDTQAEKDDKPLPIKSAYLSWEEGIDIHGDRLPHWNQDNKYIFVTFRLSDSLPKDIQEALITEIKRWKSKHPLPWDKMTEREYYTKFSHKIEDLLDLGYGSGALRLPNVAQIIKDTLIYEDGINYELIDYVIMPNHVHVLVRLLEETQIETLTQRWKSISSHKIKKVMGNEWCGWMVKYYDRLIRDGNHFYNVLNYIQKNWSHGGVLKGSKPNTEKVD